MGKIRAKQKSLILKPKTPWVPPGQPVTVGGYRIPDGMVYVGQRLTAASGRSLEPALIDPFLPVDARSSQTVLLPGGLLTYQHVSPQTRAAYLQWLADGRSAPDADPVCLLLFFYGIERRLLADSQVSRVSDAEWLKLIAEVERLIDIYRQSSWFLSYAGPFVTMTRLMLMDRRIEAFEARLDTAGTDTVWRVGPALFAAAGRPLSGPWAFALWREWRDARRGGAERRCPDEFRELFLLRYREAFPAGGFRVKESKLPLIVQYRPASPGFDRIMLLEARGLTDVGIASTHLHQLQKIADRVSSELDAYSRRAGRTRDTSSLAALALLPPELLRSREKDAAGRLGRWLDATLGEDGFARVGWAEILDHWPADTPGRLTRGAFDSFASFLGGLGYGVEPEPRNGDPVPKEGVFLFRLPRGETVRSWVPEPGYEAAAVVLQLAVAVATADGPIEARQEEQILRHIEEAAHLRRAERERLQIRLLWLIAEPQRLLGLEKRSGALSEAQRHAVIRFLIAVAGADGHVSPGEIQQLKKIYRLLRLDPDTLYSDVHSVAAGSPTIAKKAGETALELDARKIEAKLAETEQVASLLEEVFTEDEEPASSPPTDSTGLDEPHAALLRELAARTTWERVEVDRRAAALGLFPDGALETLNEAAFAHCGAPLLEGDETIDIDPDVLETLLA